MIDYRALLAKYVSYVKDAEGADFIATSDRRHEAGVVFSDDEWNELLAISRRNSPDESNTTTWAGPWEYQPYI